MTTSWQHHNNIVTTIQQHDNFEVQYHRRDHIAHFLLQFHSFYTSLTDSPPDSLIAPPQLFISSLQLFIAWHLHSFRWSSSLLVLLGSLLVFFARMPLPFNAMIGDMLKRREILWGSLLTNSQTLKNFWKHSKTLKNSQKFSKTLNNSWKLSNY